MCPKPMLPIVPPRPGSAQATQRQSLMRSMPRLLPVGLQHLVAGRADFGAIFLQAGQNGEIALVDDRAAMLLHVTRAGLLLFGRSASPVVRVGSGRKSKRRKGKGEEIFTHRVPSLWKQRVSAPREASPGTSCLD